MAVPVWTPGQILTSSDVNNWLAPNGIIKPADQSVTSSGSPVFDTDLQLPAVPSAQYSFTCFIDYEGGVQGAADFKWTWSVPASAFMRYSAAYVNTSGNAVGTNLLNDASVTTAGSNGAGNLRAVMMQGTLIMSTTAGNMTLKWAQGTSNGTATIVHAWSNLSMTRLS